MLKALRSLFTTPHRSRVNPARVEGLEKRSFFDGTLPVVAEVDPVVAAEPDTTPPTLINEQLLGNDPRNVTGVVLTFSEPLDEATAEDLKNFRVGVRTDRRQKTIEDDDRFRSNNKGLIKFESAEYNAATNSVTLTAITPFNITRRFRNIRVLGREAQGVRDAAGNLFDGNNDGVPGKDAIEKFTFQRGKAFTWAEFDTDRVSLRLTGPGRIWVIRETRTGKVFDFGDARRVYIEDADPARSILTGKVRPGPVDGSGLIEELVNSSTADVRIAADPSFRIVWSIP